MEQLKSKVKLYIQYNFFFFEVLMISNFFIIIIIIIISGLFNEEVNQLPSVN